jgi:hypothetical protein
MGKNCYELTEDDLNSYLALGYRLVSGPHSTLEECSINCGSSSSSSSSGTSASSGSSGSSSGGPVTCTDCCPYEISENLTLTITSSDCEELIGREIPLVWNLDQVGWIASVDLCQPESTMTFRMYCRDPQHGEAPTGFSLQVQSGVGWDDFATGGTCSPFSVNFTVGIFISDGCDCSSFECVVTGATSSLHCTSCCAETGIPNTLHLTVTYAEEDEGTDCTCILGKTCTLTHNGSGAWIGVLDTDCAEDINIEVTCSGGSWALAYGVQGGGVTGGGNATSQSCDPLEITFQSIDQSLGWIADSPCSTINWTFVVTD